MEFGSALPGATIVSPPSLLDPATASLADQRIPPPSVGDGRRPRPTLVIVETSPREESVSRRTARRAAGMAEDFGLESVCIDLRRLAPVAAAADAPAPEWRQVAAVVAQADGLLIAAPVHRSQLSGATRNMVEELRASVADKPTVVLAAAGSRAATVAAEQFVADLFVNFSVDVRRQPVLVYPGVTDLDKRLSDALKWLVERILASAVVT